MDFRGWIPREIMVMAFVIAGLALIVLGFVGYHLFGWLNVHMSIRWHP
jgi:hypothetical protein